MHFFATPSVEMPGTGLRGRETVRYQFQHYSFLPVHLTTCSLLPICVFFPFFVLPDASHRGENSRDELSSSHTCQPSQRAGSRGKWQQAWSYLPCKICSRESNPEHRKESHLAASPGKHPRYDQAKHTQSHITRVGENAHSAAELLEGLRDHLALLHCPLCVSSCFPSLTADQAGGTPQACCSGPTALLSPQHKFKVNKELIQPQRTKCVVISQYACALGFVFQLLFGKRLVHPINWKCMKWICREYHQRHEPWWQPFLNHSSFYSTSYCHLRKKKIIYRNLLRDRNVISSSVSERARGAVWEQVVATSHTYCCLPYDRSDVGKPWNVNWAGHSSWAGKKRRGKSLWLCQWR